MPADHQILAQREDAYDDAAAQLLQIVSESAVELGNHESFVVDMAAASGLDAELLNDVFLKLYRQAGRDI
jgi:hypothetical protein